MDAKRLKQRYRTREVFTVQDRSTGRPIATLANLSLEGAKFITGGATLVGQTYQCKLKLPHPILDQTEINFDAVCRWSKENSAQRYHESGYSLTNISETDQEIISYLILRCVIDEWSNPDGKPIPSAATPANH